ncbi:MAG: flagellar basal body-associated FliL family protein [Rhodothalassiaceae bacterium]
MADAEDQDLEEEGGEEGEGLEDLKPKRLSGKKIVLFGGGLLLLVLLAGGAWFFLGGGEDEEHKEAEAAQEAAELVFVDLPELVVNLNTGSRQSSYLRAKISLELAKESDRKLVEDRLPRVIDDFQVYLRELRPQDLSGSAGLFRLKEELLVRLNLSVAPAEVKDVLFREMLVQ